MIAGGRKNNQERPAPMNFLLNFTLTGTMTTQHLVSPGITLPVPGAKHTEQAIPVNLLYNQPLGIFNLTSTPVIEGRWYWEYYSPNVYRKLRSYRLKENLTYVINPNAGISLEKMEVAMLCQPPDVYVPEFLQWADQGRVKLESANNGKYVFSTEYLPADLLPRVPLVMNVPQDVI